MNTFNVYRWIDGHAERVWQGEAKNAINAIMLAGGVVSPSRSTPHLFARLVSTDPYAGHASTTVAPVDYHEEEHVAEIDAETRRQITKGLEPEDAFEEARRVVERRHVDPRRIDPQAFA